MTNDNKVKKRYRLVHGAFKSSVALAVHYITRIFANEECLIERLEDIQDNKNFNEFAIHYTAITNAINKMFPADCTAKQILSDSKNIAFTALEADPAYQKVLIYYHEELREHFKKEVIK